MFEKGKDAKYYDGASRWGIKGSNEISEGLTAVYNFEHAFSTEDAGLDSGGTKGRLAYVGLSGGFGALTLGQVWSASYNHAGVIRDIGNWYSSGDTSGRVGSALSYAFSGDAFSVQFDAIMAGGKDTGKAIDQWELGATVNIGDIGKVAFAHVRKENVPGEFKMTSRKIVKVTKWTNGLQWYYSPKLWKADQRPASLKAKGDGADKLMDEFEEGTDDKFVVQPVTIYVKKGNADYDTEKKQLKATAANTLVAFGHPDLDWKTYPLYPKSNNCAGAAGKNPELLTDCVKTTIYAVRDVKATETRNGIFLFFPEHVEDETVTETVRKTVYGEKSSHVSASFDLGAVTLGLGHSTTKFMDPMKTKKAKTNYIGVNGAIGDTGLDWRAWYRTKEEVKDNNMTVKSKPWGIGLGKKLGGGALAYVEHWNDGAKGAKKSGTVVGLRVDF